MVRLVLPDLSIFPSYMEALREGHYYGIHTKRSEEDIRALEADPHTFLTGLNEQGGTFVGPDGNTHRRVPYNLYWLVNGNEFIGESSVRYELNEFLAHVGGHIGYGVRPSRQRKGYAKIMTKLSLEKLVHRGLEKALLTCSDTNVPSIKTIEACGGVLENKVPSPFEKNGTARRYWIDLGRGQRA